MFRLTSFILLLAPLAAVAAEYNSAGNSVYQKAPAVGGLASQQSTHSDITTLVSPRTGIRYSLGRLGNRPVILQTQPVSAANINTVHRIVASNPALSPTSQEKAKQALLSATLDPNN